MDPLTTEAAPADRQESWPERVFLALAMIGILALCAIVTVTVVSRTLYRPLIPDDVLIVREVMVAAILLPLAAVTARRAHIAVTIFTDRLGPRAKSLLSALGHVVGTVLAGALLFAGFRLFVGAWQSGDYFDGDIYVPMWIGYATFLVALAAFLLRLLIMLARDLRGLRRSP